MNNSPTNYSLLKYSALLEDKEVKSNFFEVDLKQML